MAVQIIVHSKGVVLLLSCVGDMVVSNDFVMFLCPF